MLPEHPFTWLPARFHKRAFFFFTFAAISIMVLLNIVGVPLITDRSPTGIVSFEMAGDLANAQAMVASWGENGRIAAGISLGADYLFMPVYAAAIGLGCILVAGQFGPGNGQRLGYILAWAQGAAALLDGVENVALIQILLGNTNLNWPPVAYWCAFIKFVFIALGLLYALGGWVWTQWSKRV